VVITLRVMRIITRSVMATVSLDGWIRTSVLLLPRQADEARLSYIQVVEIAWADKKGQESFDTWPARA
jgi:hypothetical protein